MTAVSRPARLLGAAALLAVFLGTEALVVELRGVRPSVFLGLEIGAFLGLASLVLEMGMVARASRTFHAQGVQTTFMSFMMRMVVVAPLTLLFVKESLGVDHQAFALSYFGTFFLYLCWLTWKTYHTPVRITPRRDEPRGIVVRRNGRERSGAATECALEWSKR